MRTAIVILLLLSTAFSALYSDPPLANVTAHNLALAASLNDSYSPADGVNGTMVAVKLVTMDPSVDNATSSASPVLIFAWGAVAQPVLSGYGNCSQPFSSLSRSAVVNFTFQNTSYVVLTDSNIVPVPEDIVAAMANTSGLDQLQVRINATFDFLYGIDNQTPAQSGCPYFNSSLSATDAMNWSVEGNRTLFFLSAPILGEQWFQDNEFDTVLFSDSRIYKGEIAGPGNQHYQFQLYAFNITNDSYGAWHVVSVPLGPIGGVAGYQAFNTPTALSPDNFTYAYVYGFNYSYQGIGENTLSLSVESLFGDNHSFQQELLSRMLSYSGNTTELGGPASPSDSRPSAAFSTESIRTVALSLGLIGLLLAIVFLNRIHYK
jgi:hypothetical protein